MFSDRVRDYIARREAATFLLCENVSGQMERYAKERAPWKDRTAHARQSINSRAERSGSGVTISIAHGVRYGRYLEMGTSPHEIRPKNKKALYWNGASHPVRLVHYPGTQKHPAIVPAAEYGAKKLKQGLNVLWG